MKKKKKTDKFVQFNNWSNATNYRDKKAIIDQFNKSVREYRRFLEVLNGGDEKLAETKIQEAGTSLYMACEWALKNYLYNLYDKQFKTQKIDRIVREYKINFLSTKEANIHELLEKLEEEGDPSPESVGINCKIIKDNAKSVNNGPKHDATVPDPKEFRRSLEEVRKIIRIYVDNNAELDVIDDFYGDEEPWYEILEDTSEFNSAYSYVLISKEVESHNINFKGLFSIKWDLVIDMDPNSDNNGLAYNYINITGIFPKMHFLNSVDAKRKFEFSNIPHWVMANGTSDDPDTIVSPREWGSAHGRYLTGLLEEFHKEYNKPIKAFVYPPDDERNLSRIVNYFNDVYNSGDDIAFCVVSAKREYTYIDNYNFKISPLSIEDFSDYLGKFKQEDTFATSLINKELPAEHGQRIVLDDNFYATLEDSFETVYIDIDRNDESNSEKLSSINFYKGEQDISWYGLREHFDVVQPEQVKIMDKIRQDMDDRGRLLRTVYYMPGIGGTTLMRHLAWEFRGIYPTLILKRKNEQTAKNLQKIYDRTHTPLLIFADNNCIEVDEVKELQVELKHMGFAFVICYFKRQLKGVRDDDERSRYTVVQEFGRRETRQMQTKLQDLLPENDKEAFMERVQDNKEPQMLPFILSMYAFDKDFKGIKPYIANFLEKMNDQSKKIVFALSLADYGNVFINMRYFMDLFNDESANEFLLEESPGISELVKVEDIAGKTAIRIRYHLFGEEILKQMSNGREATEISFLNLVDYIVEFIENSRTDKYNINQDTLDLLRSLFITRIADYDSEKPAFSPLIMKLREEHRTSFDREYDASNDAIVRIFNKLVEVYPEEPHFTAHLARFYFYIDKNYEKGFQNIDSAIENSENEIGHVDPLLYHMKAMGYSSRITSIYSKKIMQEISADPQYDISDVKEKIQEDAENAFKLFEKVRESNIGLAGHVSDINLCIQVAELFKRLIEMEGGDFATYIASDEGKWIMEYIDRAELLWDECKQLITESAETDVDGIEERLNSLTASLNDNIDIWEQYIANAGDKNCTQARRILARSYLKKADQTLSYTDQQSLYAEVVQLMEQNIGEESQNVGNIRIWFDTIKKVEIDNQDQLIQDAIIKLNRWVSLADSVEAHYYRFVLKFIQAVEGSSAAAQQLKNLLKDLKQKAANKYNRTSIQHWLIKDAKGINALVSYNKNRRDAKPEDEMVKMLRSLTGRISENYVNDNHAYILWEGVEIYFNPSSTKGEISRANIGQKVKFGVGFSYDGPRAYNASIKVLGKDEEYVEVKREIESGIIVKCEVTKNVGYYTQVRIIGFPSEIGSIHVNELKEPYSNENRPKQGTVFDGKILRKTFDAAKQRETWQITMNLENAMEEEAGETAMARALREGRINIQ